MKLIKRNIFIFSGLLLLLAGGLAIGSFSLFQYIGGREISIMPRFTPVNPSQIPGETGSEAASTAGASTPAPTKAARWNGNDRVTMLLLGLDYRDWESSSTASRSDTMILLTIDPVSMTSGVLSVPRDLWAVIPGFNPGKINTAYYLGEAYKLPGGGPELAMKTVEQTIGVPIDYYAQIEFETFERFIDLIGGVKVNVPEPITVDPLGPHQPVTINSGTQVLNGYLALAYARNRHTSGGDFARAERQQQVIMGIRDRLLSPKRFNELVEKAPEIYAELSTGINTNLPLDDAIRLALLAVQVKDEDIKRGVINEKYVTFGRSPDDLSILIPIPDKIRELRDQIFGSGGALSPGVAGSSQDLMRLEAASISVQNGSTGSDLGTKTASFLTTNGANVTDISEAEQGYSETIVIDHTGNPYTLQYLVNLFGLDANHIRHEFDLSAPYEIEIKLGADWLNNNSLP
jgi:LCP family protein required for cell wall assembly